MITKIYQLKTAQEAEALLENVREFVFERQLKYWNKQIEEDTNMYGDIDPIYWAISDSAKYFKVIGVSNWGMFVQGTRSGITLGKDQMALQPLQVFTVTIQIHEELEKEFNERFTEVSTAVKAEA